jgi:hypothetical protein
VDRDLLGSVGPGGRAARYEIIRPSRNLPSVVINDWRRPDRYKLTDGVGGLLDGVDVRDNREDNADGHGSSRGRQYARERALSFVGRIEAGNLLHQGFMRDRLLALCGPAFEPGAVVDDASILIKPQDPLGFDRRGGGLGVDYFYNLIPQPNSGSDWEIVRDDTNTATLGVIDDIGYARSIGAPITLPVDAADQLGIMRLVAAPDEGEEVWLSVGAEHELPLVAPNTPVRLSAALNVITDGQTIAHVLITFEGPGGVELGSASGNLLETSSSLNRRSVATATSPAQPSRVRAWVRLVNDDAGGVVTATLDVGGVTMVARALPTHPISDVPGVSREPYGLRRRHGHRQANMAAPLIVNGDPSGSWIMSTSSVSMDSWARDRSEMDPDFDDEQATGIASATLVEALALKDEADGEIVLEMSDGVPVEPGVEYTFSVYARSVDADGTCQAIIYWEMFDSSIGSSVAVGSPVGGGLLTLTTEYERVHVTATAPSGATTARFGVSAPVGVGDTVAFVAPMFSIGPLSNYNDGDSPGWEWLGDGTSQAAPYCEYIVEKVDLDLKVPDDPVFGRQFRNFMLTARCRDPRIYEARRRSVELVAGSDSDNTIIKVNPAFWPLTVIEHDNAAAGIKMLNANTSVIDGSPTDDSYALIKMNDSISGTARYAQVYAKLGDSTFYDGVFNDADFVLAACNLDTGMVFARLYSSGNLELGYSDSPGMGGANVLETYEFYGSGGEWTGITGRAFWLRVWAVEDEGGGSMTISFAAWLNHPSSSAPTVQGSVGIDSITATPLVGGGFGAFALGESRSPGTLHPPRLYEYREGSVNAVEIQAAGRIGGMISTPAEVVFKGPVTAPSLTTTSSGLTIVTDADLTEGQEMIIRTDGSVSGDGDIGNLLPGTVLSDLDPFRDEVFTFAGSGMEESTTRAIVSWRRAR